MTSIDSPNLRFIWDPANFVQCGAAEQIDAWWDALHPYIGYIHIKDALSARGRRKAWGRWRGALSSEGSRPGRRSSEGAAGELAEASGYDGVLSLEPHLLEARHSSGFSGADGMEMAVKALRGLMAEVGIIEGR